MKKDDLLAFNMRDVVPQHRSKMDDQDREVWNQFLKQHHLKNHKATKQFIQENLKLKKSIQEKHDVAYMKKFQETHNQEIDRMLQSREHTPYIKQLKSMQEK